MALSPRKPSPFPSSKAVVEFIRESPRKVGKREIARAFRLDAEQKRDLQQLLRKLELDGTLQKGRRRRYSGSGQLPEVAVLSVTGIDPDGELLARPANWDKSIEPPVIYLVAQKSGHPALAPGDRILARLTKGDENTYTAKTIRRLSTTPARVLGVFGLVGGTGRICPTDRRAKSEFVVRTGDSMGARPGDLIRAEVVPGHRYGLPQARVVERLNSAQGPRALSLIALYEHDVPIDFPADAVDQAEAAGPAPAEDREDLRGLPLVTIDSADARDFDDAVWAEADDDPKSTGGWHIIVAIADVAWYVRPGDALDRAAYQRGTSVYFPDRVIPMLPEALSNGWCSLVPEEDRPCLVAHLWIDSSGRLRRHRFGRAVICSAARLTYSQVQAARDGRADDTTAALPQGLIASLYGAYEALARQRAKRGTLELEIPERRVELADDGTVTGISERERLVSHKLIEEFMITANVAAAETLEKHHAPCMYRIHDQPGAEKFNTLVQVLRSINLRFTRGQVIKPSQFNQILSKAANTPHAHMVNLIVLRSQAQAEYGPDNIGHFGLGLRRYCHFTSPIRRYPDLIVHRALIDALKLGANGPGVPPPDLAEAGEHLSMTERRAVAAERDAIDRFSAQYLADRVGAVFAGRINGVTHFGLFVTLDETGADGLVPLRSLSDDYYDHDEGLHLLTGRRTGREFRLGQAVEVMLTEVNPLSGSMIFGVLGGNEPAPARYRGRRIPSARGPRR